MLTGTAAIDGTGNALANKITGNAAANVLTGGDGNDTLSGSEGSDWLYGGHGSDTMAGGIGNDVFVLSAPETGAKDSVTDFRVRADKIGFSAADFGLSVGNGLTASGSLDPDWFVKGSHSTATQTHGQFVYDTSTHTLMWDSDGTGAGAAEALATLNLNISSSDLLVL